MGLVKQRHLWQRLQLQPQRSLALLAVVVAVLLCALVASDLLRDHAQQFAAASNRTSSLTRVLEEHARQSMRRVELALTMAAQDVQAQQKQRALTTGTGTRLRAYLPQDGLVVSFALLNAEGQVTASTRSESQTDLPLVNDRDYYSALRDSPPGVLFVGAAVKSRLSGLWIIPVSVRLAGGRGEMLMAAVDPEYFQRLYQSIDTGEDGFVTLFTSKGWAVARWPFASDIAERNWLDSPLFQQHLPNATESTLRQQDSASGVDSVYSYRALPDYPLVVAVGISLDATLKPWRQRAALECAGLFLVLLFLGGATALLAGQLRSRVQAESALQLSELSLLKSSLPTLWISADARVLRVNQAACELHGYSEADMLRMSVLDLNPGMPMSLWSAHWTRLREARHLQFETTHRTRQGRDIPVEVELNFIEFAGQEYNFSFVRDLTTRKRDEAEVQRSADLLRGAIDAVDEAFVLFDRNDRLVYCNTKYVELYPDLADLLQPGAVFEDLIRIGARRGLYRESMGHEEDWIAERLKSHRAGSATRIQKRDDGRVLRVIDRKTPDGNIVGIRVDITEMVRATEEAQEASRTKSQFLANMSHEIRTPMNAILGLLALLQNTDLSTTQRDYASKTTSAAQSLLGLLNDILDFSKVEAGKMELDPQLVRLDAMLRDIAVILSSNLGGKAIELLFDIDSAVPAGVIADAMRLQQVLVNLSSNAIKFTERGQVVLRLRCKPLPFPETESKSESESAKQACLEFSIQDSGIGIALDKQQHIFTGFSQAEASTTRRFGGTGLGLAICKRLVELMGGTLELQSAPGLGSTFSFSLCLPIAQTPLNPVAPGLALPLVPPQVLVVDDNPMAREILAAMTRACSWPTTLAPSGAQALECVRARHAAGEPPFDVMCVDWQMPDMDGWETVRQLRLLGKADAPMPRIVMLSSNGRDTLQLRTALEQAQIDAFLVKPVIASALQDAVLNRVRVDARRAPRSSSRPLVGMRILVVEDNLINQQVAEELLNAEGALVSLAANGQLGVDAVAASQPPFDVVLMDVQMPVLDGYGATRKIRDELGLISLPIVAMTANAMASDRSACLAAGMNEHVGKPFDMAHLVSVLLTTTGWKAGHSHEPAQQEVPLHAVLQHLDGVARAVPAVSSPYLDVDGALARLSGLTDLYVDVLQEFCQSLDAVEQSFRQAAAQQQMRELMVQMHTLKGTAATLGATPLSEHAAVLEKLFRHPRAELLALDHLPGLLDLVRSTHQDVLLAVQRLQGGLEAEPDSPLQGSTVAQSGAAKEFLQELSDLLRASDLAAVQRFAQRGDVLDALSRADVAALALALRGLDLDLALQLCVVLMNPVDAA
jgi:PAS domain S-box-containing protein